MLQTLVIWVTKRKMNFIIVENLRDKLRGKLKTKEIAIEWFIELFKHFSGELLKRDDPILGLIIQSINFKESKLTELALKLLWLMAKKYDGFLNEVIATLLKRFKKESGIIMGDINNIIRIMWQYIDPKVVFSEFATELKVFDDYTFVGFMVETLDLILAGSEEYKTLRDILNKRGFDEEKQTFFNTLFQTWWFKNYSAPQIKNPISALTLWLTSRKYKLAYKFLLCIWSNIEFVHDDLIQICNIVQLIESPTFLTLRLDLLDPVKNYYLIKTLQCILMMLPIGKAFTALKTRLEWIKLDPKYKLLAK